jgi:hypothetical protein
MRKYKCRLNLLAEVIGDKKVVINERQKFRNRFIACLPEGRVFRNNF